MVDSEVFERLSESELQDMFVWDGKQARVKPWLQEGITWEVADVSDQETVRSLGEHDLVVASNFLCHMDDGSAERCMRNFGAAHPSRRIRLRLRGGSGRSNTGGARARMGAGGRVESGDARRRPCSSR